MEWIDCMTAARQNGHNCAGWQDRGPKIARGKKKILGFCDETEELSGDYICGISQCLCQLISSEGCIRPIFFSVRLIRGEIIGRQIDRGITLDSIYLWISPFHGL